MMVKQMINQNLSNPFLLSKANEVLTSFLICICQKSLALALDSLRVPRCSNAINASKSRRKRLVSSLDIYGYGGIT
jgi:hypothetical protein